MIGVDLHAAVGRETRMDIIVVCEYRTTASCRIYEEPSQIWVG